MPKPPKSDPKTPKVEDIELVHDAWPPFEQFVKKAAKAGEN
jgi:hypothetical protein